jgi:6-pyruvoyltetrahydropterin/6-carboxytetrahydropterin synthase
MSNFQSAKILDLGSCAFRQPNAKSHCRWLHGYRLQAKFWFACDELDDNNWVVDFGSLKGLKQKLEKQFDHTTCISADDPSLTYFKDLASEDICDLRIMENGVGIERFAEYCFDVSNHTIRSMTKGRCWVDRVEVWEHEKNSAICSKMHTAKTKPSCEELAEDIATTVDNRQQELDLRLDHGEPLKQPDSEEESNDQPTSTHPSGDPAQHKITGKWVDPDLANKPNSWAF